MALYRPLTPGSAARGVVPRVLVASGSQTSSSAVAADVTDIDPRVDIVVNSLQDNIERQRIFGGFKAKYYVFAFTFEIDYALAGDSVDDVAGITTPCDTAPASEKNRCDATDQSGAQATYSFAVSLDF